MKIRLEFLKFIISNSNLLLQINQADVLWKCLVTEMIVPEEREICFQWLEKSLPSSEFVPFDDSISQHLFENKMTQIDYTQLNQSAYSVFEQYFLSLNEKSNKIRVIDRKQDGKANYIINSDLNEKLLFGYDKMWEIALNAEHEGIFIYAINCLNMLFQIHPSEFQRKSYLRVREQYITKCLSFIDQSISSDPINLMHLERCLLLLKVLPPFPLLLFFFPSFLPFFLSLFAMSFLLQF